jgi:hypothetical protein
MSTVGRKRDREGDVVWELERIVCQGSHFNDHPFAMTCPQSRKTSRRIVRRLKKLGLLRERGESVEGMLKELGYMACLRNEHGAGWSVEWQFTIPGGGQYAKTIHARTAKAALRKALKARGGKG